MICPKCGGKMDDSYKFCIICGAKLQYEEEYKAPPLALLRKNNRISFLSDEYIRKVANIINMLFINYGVSAHVFNVTCGPVYTRYEIKPDPGVSIRNILGLVDDIKLHLAVEDIIVEAPIPNQTTIGFSIVNPSPSCIFLRDLLESEAFTSKKSVLSISVGKDMLGKNIIADVSEMPHLLIGGVTGSGKSMFIHSIILSIIYKANPQEVKLILIDTRSVELSVYNGIPHLLFPVITDSNKVVRALKWACFEMNKRYQIFSSFRVNNIDAYNNLVGLEKNDSSKLLCKLLIIIENISDILELTGDSEKYLTQLAQYGRSVGIHIVLSSSFPCKRNLSMLIKSNLMSRISFHVATKSDSKVILDKAGAEKLFPYGDMYFYPVNQTFPLRVHSAYVSYQEIQRIVNYLRNHTIYSENLFVENCESMPLKKESKIQLDRDSVIELDPYFAEAGALVIQKNKASIGMLQRELKIGFNRADGIMKQLTDCGVIRDEIGTMPGKILMTKEEFEEFILKSNISF